MQLKRDFRFLLKREELENSPSRREGISRDDERMLRVYGCELIQTSGILLKLPQQVCATAQVLFHRFFCKRSFVQFKVEFAAMASIWLASKLEEYPRALRDVLQVYYRLEKRQNGKNLLPLEYMDPVYVNWRQNVIVVERYMLREFGFTVRIEHAHKVILVLLSPQVLNASPQLMQETWNLLNDSLRTVACVCYSSETIACAMIHLASQRIGEPLPSAPPWWEMMEEVRYEEICEVGRMVEDLYRLKKAHTIPVYAYLSNDEDDIKDLSEEVSEKERVKFHNFLSS